jgi:ubiquinone/menaquinone biosynthesis C-methylase UbiE
MDTAEEAAAYDAMDHLAVNRLFVTDLLDFVFAQNLPQHRDLLDLGTGTARIPIELCKQNTDVRIMAVDLAFHMLDIARINIELANLMDRIQLGHADSKRLPYQAEFFHGVISNSLLHHLPEPIEALREAVRVTSRHGYLFFRDLMRPDSDAEVNQLVASYVGKETQPAQQMFADSLRAALRLEEIQEIVEQLGFPADTVRATTDRHWTWQARVDQRR